MLCPPCDSEQSPFDSEFRCTIMPHTMFRRLRQVVTFALAGTLAVPAINESLCGPLRDDSVGYRDVVLPAPNGVEVHQDHPSKGEFDGGGSEEDGHSYPVDRLSRDPGPLEMFKRGHRISGLHSTIGRSYEKHASGLHAFPAKSPSLQRTGFADRCIRSWFSVVALPVKAHAPPQIRSFLARAC